MADQQYDIPKKLLRLFHEKEKIRHAVRQMVLKREGNPYITPSALHDPAITKYHAMIAYRADYLRATPKNVSGFLIFVVFPVLGTFIHLVYRDKKKEELLRSGKVSYKERYQKTYL